LGLLYNWDVGSLSRSLEPAPVDFSARSASLPVTLVLNVSVGIVPPGGTRELFPSEFLYFSIVTAALFGKSLAEHGGAYGVPTSQCAPDPEGCG
jgi:hypothetical protein